MIVPYLLHTTSFLNFYIYLNTKTTSFHFVHKLPTNFAVHTVKTLRSKLLMIWMGSKVLRKIVMYPIQIVAIVSKMKTECNNTIIVLFNQKCHCMSTHFQKFVKCLYFFLYITSGMTRNARTLFSVLCIIIIDMHMTNYKIDLISKLLNKYLLNFLNK